MNDRETRLPHNLSPMVELAEVRAALDRVASERDELAAKLDPLRAQVAACVNALHNIAEGRELGSMRNADYARMIHDNHVAHATAYVAGVKAEAAILAWAHAKNEAHDTARCQICMMETRLGDIATDSIRRALAASAEQWKT